MCELADWCSLTQDAQAAWLQAVLSGVAIIAAALFPVWHSRREVGRRVGSVVALMAHISDAADALVATLVSVEGSNAAKDWDPAAWTRLLGAMDAIPIHELPDEGLVAPVLLARECVADIAADYARTIDRARNGYPPRDAEVSRIKRRSQAISEHYDACVGIDRIHRLRLLFRITWWLARRRAKSKSNAHGAQ